MFPSTSVDPNLSFRQHEERVGSGVSLTFIPSQFQAVVDGVAQLPQQSAELQVEGSSTAVPDAPTSSAPASDWKRDPKTGKLEVRSTGNVRETPCQRCVLNGEPCIDALDGRSGKVRKMCCACAQAGQLCKLPDEADANGQKRAADDMPPGTPLPKKARSFGPVDETSGSVVQETEEGSVRRSARKHVDRRHWSPSDSAAASLQSDGSQDAAQTHNSASAALADPGSSRTFPLRMVEVVIPSKRGRGRPPGVKRPRGRPRKYPVQAGTIVTPRVAAPVAGPSQTSGQTTASRPRGRPRKTPLDVATATTSAAPLLKFATPLSSLNFANPTNPNSNPDVNGIVPPYITALFNRLDHLSHQLYEHQKSVETRCDQLQTQMVAMTSANTSGMQSQTAAMDLYRSELRRTNEEFQGFVRKMTGK